MYENVHSNLALVLLFVRTEVECGKGQKGVLASHDGDGDGDGDNDGDESVTKQKV